MTETPREKTARQQAVRITSIQKDIEFIKEAMERNFLDHKEIKDAFKAGLSRKVSGSRFRPVELIAYGLAGGVLFWALNQLLSLVETAKSFF